jgi:hypothetical protein
MRAQLDFRIIPRAAKVKNLSHARTQVRQRDQNNPA